MPASGEPILSSIYPSHVVKLHPTGLLRSGLSRTSFRELVVPRVELERVTKIFDRPGDRPVRALSEVTLDVAGTRPFVIIGPSGSGKTTVLRLIAGLEMPTSGVIRIGDKVINDVPAKQRDVAMVFQSPALYPHMSVYENIAFGLRLRGCAREETDQRVRGAAEKLGLAGCLQAKPMALSGGQRQRVSIARAIVRRPSLLLFDEPLSQIDPSLRAQLRNELSRLLQELGTTMVYVTHDQTEAMLVGSQVAVLRDGVVEQVGDPVHLYQNPANLFVAGFIGSPGMNFFPGILISRGNRLMVQSQKGLLVALDASTAYRVETYAGGPVILGVRPEDIRLHGDPSVSAAKALLEGTVLAVQHVGAEVYLDVKASPGESFTVRMSAGTRAPGQSCAFVMDLSRVHFFEPGSGKAIG